MTPEQWMAQKIRERGVKQSFLAGKIGVRESKLSYCLTGRSRMQVPVFLALCYELQLDPLAYLEAAHEGA
jgi:hypothetical protein